MLTKVIPIIVGLLLMIGGIWTIFAGNKYFKFLKTKGSDNIFSPLTVFYGYFIGFMFLIVGLAICFRLI